MRWDEEDGRRRRAERAGKQGAPPSHLFARSPHWLSVFLHLKQRKGLRGEKLRRRRAIFRDDTEMPLHVGKSACLFMWPRSPKGLLFAHQRPRQKITFLQRRADGDFVFTDRDAGAKVCLATGGVWSVWFYLFAMWTFNKYEKKEAAAAV